MKFIPYEKVTFSSPLSIHEFNKKLTNVVGKPRFIGSNDNEKFFTGMISEDAFDIQKYHYSRFDIYSPRVKGIIQSNMGGGVVLHTTFTSNRYLLFFMLFFIFVVLGGLLQYLIDAKPNFSIGGLVLMIGVYLFWIVLYNSYSNKIKKKFIDIFGAKII